MRFSTVVLLFVFSLGATARAEPANWLQTLDDYPHASAIEKGERAVNDLEIGTGALQKIRGVWRFKSSIRRTGLLQRMTWQVVDGFSASEVFDTVRARIEEESGLNPVFHCDGRSCGPSVQWANRVFQQRLLYGRDDTQQYAVYEAAADQAAPWVLVMYAAGRTADRQYFHIDLLWVD